MSTIKLSLAIIEFPLAVIKQSLALSKFQLALTNRVLALTKLSLAITELSLALTKLSLAIIELSLATSDLALASSELPLATSKVIDYQLNTVLTFSVLFPTKTEKTAAQLPSTYAKRTNLPAKTKFCIIACQFSSALAIFQIANRWHSVSVRHIST